MPATRLPAQPKNKSIQVASRPVADCSNSSNAARGKSRSQALTDDFRSCAYIRKTTPPKTRNQTKCPKFHHASINGPRSPAGTGTRKTIKVARPAAHQRCCLFAREIMAISANYYRAPNILINFSSASSLPTRINSPLDGNADWGSGVMMVFPSARTAITVHPVF